MSGFDWCKGEEKVVGIDSLTERMLCANHNSKLSLFDQTAKGAIESFVTGSSKNAIDGNAFERWLVKTAVNLSLRSGLKIGAGMTGAGPGVPPDYLLDVLFRGVELTMKLGAYFVFPRGRVVYKAGEICFAPIFRDGEIGGALFGLRGQFIFLNLLPGHAPASLGAICPNAIDRAFWDSDLVYRPRELLMINENSERSVVEFQWKMKDAA